MEGACGGGGMRGGRVGVRHVIWVRFRFEAGTRVRIRVTHMATVVLGSAASSQASLERAVRLPIRVRVRYTWNVLFVYRLGLGLGLGLGIPGTY